MCSAPQRTRSISSFSWTRARSAEAEIDSSPKREKGVVLAWGWRSSANRRRRGGFAGKRLKVVPHSLPAVPLDAFDDPLDGFSSVFFYLRTAPSEAIRPSLIIDPLSY